MFESSEWKFGALVAIAMPSISSNGARGLFYELHVKTTMVD